MYIPRHSRIGFYGYIHSKLQHLKEYKFNINLKLRYHSAGACSDDDFQCPEEEGVICIPRTYLCDFYNDCRDGSDEQNCGTGMSTE